jgi:hypothetical protein
LSRCLSLAFALASLAASSRGEQRLDVSGAIVEAAPRIAVRVTLTNRGDKEAAGPIDVQGELFGEQRSGRLASRLEPGASGDVALEFDGTPPKPGLYALTLLVEHPLDGAPDAAGNPPMASERAWLLLALGANPAPAVRMRAEAMALDVRGSLAVRLESADGEAARVRLRALTARGLRTEGGPIEVDVPARGEARALVPLVRAGAPRGTRQALLLVAETADAPLARTSVAVANVDVSADPSLFPRLRTALLGLGLVLVAVATVYELWKATRAPASDPA